MTPLSNFNRSNRSHESTSTPKPTSYVQEMQKGSFHRLVSTGT